MGDANGRRYRRRRLAAPERQYRQWQSRLSRVAPSGTLALAIEGGLQVQGSLVAHRSRIGVVATSTGGFAVAVSRAAGSAQLAGGRSKIPWVRQRSRRMKS